MTRFEGPDCGVAGCAREVGHIGDHRRDPAAPYTVAFTGSREFADARLVEQVIRRLVRRYPASPAGAGLVVKVGDARGADALVRAECPRWGVWPSVEVCHWPERGTKRQRWEAAHERNGRVVADADLLIALRATGPETPGTNDAIAQAKALAIPVVVFREGMSLT